MRKSQSDFGSRISDWRISVPIPHFAIRNPEFAIGNRHGVTLVELLITVAIISILAAILLGVAAVAGDTAREARTKNIIARLHTLLMEHYDTYKTRRVRLKRKVEDAINDNYSNPSIRGAVLAEARLYALREMMLMEIPDRWSDILLNDVGNNPLPSVFLDVSRSSIERTPLTETYYRRYLQIWNGTNRNSRSRNTPDEIILNQSAECLYLVITLATGDGEARELFGESTIGDTDGDGAPEFIDGWGNPIHFLRWAPGLDSELQLNATDYVDARDPNWLQDASADHDPFDIYRRDPIAFRLVPLIYSAGSDEAYGIIDEPQYVTWRKPTSVSFADSPPFIVPPLTPFIIQQSGYPNVFLGSMGTLEEAERRRSEATDNIHNHLVVGE